MSEARVTFAEPADDPMPANRRRGWSRRRRIVAVLAAGALTLATSWGIGAFTSTRNVRAALRTSESSDICIGEPTEESFLSQFERLAGKVRERIAPEVRPLADLIIEQAQSGRYRAEYYDETDNGFRLHFRSTFDGTTYQQTNVGRGALEVTSIDGRPLFRSGTSPLWVHACSGIHARDPFTKLLAYLPAVTCFETTATGYRYRLRDDVADSSCENAQPDTVTVVIREGRIVEHRRSPNASLDPDRTIIMDDPEPNSLEQPNQLLIVAEWFSSRQQT